MRITIKIHKKWTLHAKSENYSLKTKILKN